MECRICHNMEDNKIIQVRERRLNKGDIFSYLHCAKCGTMQLVDLISENEMGHFYGYDYIAHTQTNHVMKTTGLKYNIKRLLGRYVSSPKTRTEAILKHIPMNIRFLYLTDVNERSKILDVGCGNGNWIGFLYSLGYHNVSGVDLYCKQIPYTNISFVNGTIFDMEGVFDLVAFHHSFEHMNNPREVLAKVHDLLDDNGTCLIRIPVSDCLAFKEYGADWYQIDAPRHYYLYTPKSLEILCGEAGLKIENVYYDSTADQFVVSEYYKKTDLPYNEIQKKNHRSKSNYYSSKADHVNHQKTGDQACFLIKKK